MTYLIWFITIITTRVLAQPVNGGNSSPCAGATLTIDPAIFDEDLDYPDTVYIISQPQMSQIFSPSYVSSDVSQTDCSADILFALERQDGQTMYEAIYWSEGLSQVQFFETFGSYRGVYELRLKAYYSGYPDNFASLDFRVIMKDGQDDCSFSNIVIDPSFSDPEITYILGSTALAYTFQNVYLSTTVDASCVSQVTTLSISDSNGIAYSDVSSPISISGWTMVIETSDSLDVQEYDLTVLIQGSSEYPPVEAQHHLRVVIVQPTCETVTMVIDYAVTDQSGITNSYLSYTLRDTQQSFEWTESLGRNAAGLDCGKQTITFFEDQVDCSGVLNQIV